MEAQEKKEKKNIVLVPTDFSEVCENAVNHGVEIAKSLNFSLSLLHVVNKDTKEYLDEKNLEADTLLNKLSEYAKELKAKHNIEINTIIEKGDLYKKVGKVASDIGANMVILGTHGKVGFQHLTGSYALKVITNSTVPTLVVQKKSFAHGYKNIVYPVTVSTSDRQKVNWAIAIAKTFGATIHLIPKHESEKYLKRRIMSVTKQIKDIFAENGIKHVDKVSDERGGNFAKQVIDYAVANEADLIMIMTMKDHLLPMLTTWDEQIVFNSSQIPVICINPVNFKKTGWHD
jgi:nucleotide-binding universal stress UspA family protein